MGGNVGVARGVPAALGVVCGMAALMFAVSFGLGALILQTPLILTVVKGLGAAVLLWLAWKIATSSTAAFHSSDTEPSHSARDSSEPEPEPHSSSLDPASPFSDVEAAPASSRADPLLEPPSTNRILRLVSWLRPDAARPVGLVAAAAFQWANPKSWLACTSAAAAFQPGPSEQAAVHAAVLAALFALVALPSCLVWLAFGAIVQRALRSPRALRTFNLVMAALLVVSVALIFLT